LKQRLPLVTKIGSYCTCALSWPLPELLIHGAGEKDRSSGDENELCVGGLYEEIHAFGSVSVVLVIQILQKK